MGSQIFDLWFLSGSWHWALPLGRSCRDLWQGDWWALCPWKSEPEVFALSRTTYPKDPPTGRKLELIKQQMLRIHRASGHASFGNLQRLLRARGAPPWSVELAGNLQCPSCIESKRPLLHPPASTQDDPVLFEVVGTDIFEFEHNGKKHKFVLWRDRASSYTIALQSTCKSMKTTGNQVHPTTLAVSWNGWWWTRVRLGFWATREFNIPPKSSKTSVSTAGLDFWLRPRKPIGF